MNIVWNRELKRLAAMFLALFCIGCLTMNVCVTLYCNRVRETYNDMLAAVFGNVLAAYPETAEEELVSVLNHHGNEALGADILARYGVLADYGSASFASQEEGLHLLRAGANILFCLLLAMIMALLLFYFKKRQRRISGLTEYMNALYKDGYRLEVEDNGDDELSGLRNEVYKLTVLLKEQAQRAKAQKRALADTMEDISHQLKTPLTSATVLMDNLSDNVDMDAATRQRFMGEVTRQLTDMSWLVTTMLKLSKLEAGVLELERTRIRGRELVEEALQRLEIAAQWRGIAFSVDLSEGMEILADRRWTVEALMNLIKNAMEHSPEGGTVEIAGEENEVYAQIAIRDHGKGITEEERKKLFARFYNGNSTREDSIGIGLALAKKIVEGQNGHITVESQVGEGTTFIVRFLKH